ncbi:protein NUCLEAR FUSION DEFECTIVE 4-like [Pistacia vera]|uniref:protein NUCLEAR FUSION DEFECTIVE 4-like n=1 Tax=Pistacia vera TaxID=55513 RepID=UPI0012637B47|nr:protein NUCLEAR FUSION DEFECTIVE 4-like [Pistacia vera]
MDSLNAKWIATVASIWIQCSTGASYTFAIYSSTLKSTQDYDQSTLAIVSVFKDIGANVGILSGLLYSFITLKHNIRFKFLRGPWEVHLAGSILCFIGYFFMWLSVVGLTHRPPLQLMSLYMFMAAQAQTFFNTANIVTGVINFGDYSGTIVGILKGFLGLSGAVLIQVYETICKGNPSTYLLILALLPTFVSLSLMCLVSINQTNSVDDKKHLNAFSAVALTLAAYIMIIIIMENIFSFPFWAHISTSIILVLLLAYPLKIAITAQRENTERFEQTFYAERTYHELPGDASEVKHVSCDRKLPVEEDMNLLQAMGTGNFWLLFIAMICGMGSGMATINNLSQVGESLGYTTIETNSLVSLWSIWNFLGRFGAGSVSDIFLHRNGWARPFFTALTLATMCIGHIVIASGIPKILYVGTVIVGVCYGSQWSLMPTISSELFGVGHMGTIFNTIGIASPVGSYIFSVRVIGYFYDKVANGENDSCYGTHCFMLSFLIMASVAFLGCLVAFLLFFRTRRFYNQVVFGRLQHSSRT